ncbi:ATPase-activating ribosome biosynthesis protein [Sorochytrium milnesiophthora]
MRLEKCYFCSSTVYPGHGIMFVRNDAKQFRFCRSKCHKNFKMKRNPRKGKEMVVDAALDAERRRNIPVRYDRNLMTTTLTAMKRIQQVRDRRERAFYKTRVLAKKKESERSNMLKDVKKNPELVPFKTIKKLEASKILESTQKTDDMEL